MESKGNKRYKIEVNNNMVVIFLSRHFAFVELVRQFLGDFRLFYEKIFPRRIYGFINIYRKTTICENSFYKCDTASSDLIFLLFSVINIYRKIAASPAPCLNSPLIIKVITSSMLIYVLQFVHCFPTFALWR